MYNFLLVVIVASIILFIFECAYVFYHMSTKMHAYLFFYLMACIINNGGYLMEITAKTSEAAYVATRTLYLGKINMSFCLLIFSLKLCRIKMKTWVPFAIFSLHALLYIMIITNDFHHLYYTTINFVNTGLFPHNVYGHGPLYYAYMVIPFLYSFIAIGVAARAIPKMKTVEEKKQLLYLIVAPISSLVGVLFFFSGKTGGFDTSNVGILFSALFMMISLFKYNLIDTVDMVKNKIADSLNDGLIAIDNYGQLVYANDMATCILPGLKGVEGNSSSALLSDLEERAINKDRISINERTYAITAQDLHQSGLYRGRLFILDDMTETINYTKEIEQERDRADIANAAKSNFLSNMSHEIRTPMNAVVGMTDILLRNNPKESDREYLENIKSSGNALLDIINDILDFSKIESGKMEIVSAEYEPLPLINDLKMIFSTRIGEKPIRMIYEIDDKLPAKLLGDAVRIRQILINIVNNAIKFTDVGYVRLVVKTERNIENEDMINLKVSVQDSGTGIKDEDLGKLFTSFSQVDMLKNHTKEGTGLGLTITKQLLELMGGSIGVDSVYGKGSDFFFTIPQKVIDSTPAKDVNYRRESDDIMNFMAPEALILMAEDNEVNVRVARGLFEPFKFKLDVAPNGLSALKMISENHYDLVLMDHMMPIMDGVEATTRIREFEDEYYKRVPIIALTANAVVGAKEEFLEAGMNDFVGKPIDMKEISRVLRKWLPKELIIDIAEPENSSGSNDINGSIISNDSENLVADNIDNKNMAIQDSTREEKMAGELDRSIGIQYCGTEELLEAVLEDFYRLIDTKAEKIEQLLRDNDIRNYTIEVHALKSTARMIGATKMSELAFEMEQAGNANNMDAINEKTPILMEMYRSYKETLSYFDGNQASDDDKEEVPVSTIKAELFRLNLAAKDFDMDEVDEAMAKLNKYKMPNSEAKDILGKLDTMVRDVDFDHIPETAASLMKVL